MKWFYDLKIAKKLFLSFSLVSLMTVALGCFSIFQLNQLNKASTASSTNWLPSIQALSKIELALSRLRNIELLHVVAGNARSENEAEAAADEELNTLAKQQNIYAKLITEKKEKTAYSLAEQEIQSFLTEHANIIALSTAGQKQEATALLNAKSAQAYTSAIVMLDKLASMGEQGFTASSVIADKTHSTALTMITGALLAAVLMSFLLAATITKVISTPIREALAITQRVAQGDLNSIIKPQGKDETGELIHALKVMNDNLFQIASEIRMGTDTISTSSHEISTGTLDLSSRTEEQASLLKDTASSMEKLTSTVKKNAHNARQASQLAASASNVAQQGGVVVRQVVQTMSAIDDSSRKIVDIIGVIDGIAFQTNILALNATVEAARAGEQGRGFSIVASEVRNLAQRAATAAKEIKVLIDDSVSKVSDGQKLVTKAGSTMEEIVSSVGHVTDIVSKISAEGMEQSSGIEKINQAVTQMDQGNQRNAALVEQAAAAVQSLQNQAEYLTQAASIFTLNNGTYLVPKQSATKAHHHVTRPFIHLVRKDGKPFTRQKRHAIDVADSGSWEQF